MIIVYCYGIIISVIVDKLCYVLLIEICIFDNGFGVLCDIVDYLFDLFVLGRWEGQGFGFVLVDKLMCDMGGIV